MPSESNAAHEDSLKFLQGIDERHNAVLDELEQLNGRIEQVLGEYQQSRQQSEDEAPGAHPAVPPP